MQIKFKVTSQANSLKYLFGHCQLRVFLEEDTWVDIGRFSASAIDRLRMYKQVETRGCLAEIGDFCEFADSELLLAGEHRNHQVINQVLSGCPPFQKLLEINGFNATHFAKGIMKIGHGVVVSHGAKILSGVKVGDGAIVGAGAVVVKDVPDFAIVAGVPAKVIKFRDVDQSTTRSFWEMNLPQVFEFATGKRFQNDGTHYKRDNWLVIKMVPEKDNKEGRFSGFELKGVQTPTGFIQPKPHSPFMQYCRQVSLEPGKTAEWVSDPFKLQMQK